MNDALTQWFSGCGVAPGMMAGGVRRPDGVCLSQSFSETCPVEKMEAALARLAEFAPQLAASGLVPQWSTWNFAQGRLRVVIRPDGCLLALLAAPDTAAAQNLDLFSGEFLMIDFGG